MISHSPVWELTGKSILALVYCLVRFVSSALLWLVSNDSLLIKGSTITHFHSLTIPQKPVLALSSVSFLAHLLSSALESNNGQHDGRDSAPSQRYQDRDQGQALPCCFSEPAAEGALQCWIDLQGPRCDRRGCKLFNHHLSTSLPLNPTLTVGIRCRGFGTS